jgi:NAD(P)H-flavin reductase
MYYVSLHHATVHLTNVRLLFAICTLYVVWIAIQMRRSNASTKYIKQNKLKNRIFVFFPRDNGFQEENKGGK